MGSYLSSKVSPIINEVKKVNNIEYVTPKNIKINDQFKNESVIYERGIEKPRNIFRRTSARVTDSTEYL